MFRFCILAVFHGPFGPHGRFENKRHQLRTLRLISSPNVYLGSRYSEKLSDQFRPLYYQRSARRILQLMGAVDVNVSSVIYATQLCGTKVKDVFNSASSRDQVSVLIDRDLERPVNVSQRNTEVSNE